VFYLGGDAYSAPAILISDGETQKLYYLHRDYLGSIVMLTDEDGNIAERRHFDPWGQVVKVEDGSGKVLQGLTLLDRGFTGHEHLQTVGLIHMNGRLYDPALHRFLQPDNFVQDPFNTQNFNRYGYCLNNPLLYTDPTGEWFVIDDAIAMLVGGVVNLTINAIQGNVTSFWSGLGYFAVGVGAGAASLYGGPLAAGAVLGLGNNITSQVSQNGWSNISLTSAIIDTGIGMGSAYLGGQISSKFSGVFSKVFNSISSPILKNVLISGTSNAASGFLLSAGISFAYTKDFDQALKDGVKGAGYGLALGSALGVVQGFQYAREKGVNPWNGKTYLYEIGEGTRRAYIMNELGYKTIKVEIHSGEIFEVPIKNLRSFFKTSLSKDDRYEVLYNRIKKEGQISPIYVSPGNRGIPVSKIKLEP